MEEEDLYQVKKQRPVKIDENTTYQKYSLSLVKNVPYDEMRILLELFLNKAANNMGNKLKDEDILAVLDYVYSDFGIITVVVIGSGIIKGSLGKYGEGKFCPRIIYNWLHEASREYFEKQKKKPDVDFSNAMDLNKYPAGKAIIWKIDHVSKQDWDNVPLKEVAELIGKGIQPTLIYFGIRNA